MAKKAPAKKAPAKRKPRAKKPVEPAIDLSEKGLVKPIAWRSWIVSGAKAVALIVVGLGGGVWWAGGIPIGPGPSPADAVSAVFDIQESEFRKSNAELAVKLRAGEFSSEKQAEDWMSERYKPKAEEAWHPLLLAEKAAFGEDRWTAEKQAAFIEEYAR